MGKQAGGPPNQHGVGEGAGGGTAATLDKPRVCPPAEHGNPTHLGTATKTSQRADFLLDDTSAKPIMMPEGGPGSCWSVSAQTIQQGPRNDPRKMSIRKQVSSVDFRL